jgi:hypothetical protein
MLTRKVLASAAYITPGAGVLCFGPIKFASPRHRDRPERILRMKRETDVSGFKDVWCRVRDLERLQIFGIIEAAASQAPPAVGGSTTAALPRTRNPRGNRAWSQREVAQMRPLAGREPLLRSPVAPARLPCSGNAHLRHPISASGSARGTWVMSPVRSCSNNLDARTR